MRFPRAHMPERFTARPVAASGGFPYRARTVGEVWGDQIAPPHIETKRWCGQCERCATDREARGCQSRFCGLRGAA